jgi:Cu(I)/Ag(I) efflux system protein CusF
MKPFAPILFLATLLPGPVLAQQKAEEPATHHAATPSAAVANSAELADGEVRKIDKDAGKITLRHGEIKSLDMPGMTMVFQVKDAALLDKIKVGDKVKFRAEKSGGGFMVTVIEVAK